MISDAFVNLLDVEPDLASRLRDDDRAEAAQQLRMHLLDVPAGDWLAAAGGRPGPLGFMVVEGLLLQEVRLASRSAMQLLGPGDVVLPGCSSSEMLDAEVRWSAAVPSRVAILDERVLQGCFGLWPGLGLGLVERTGGQLMRTAMHAAIAQLPRVDQRLEAMFWDLAGRWGHVTPSGIHLPLPLSHEVLARLVGGRRPTITLALKAMADRGIVARRPDRTWLLVAPEPSLPTEGLIGAAPRLPAFPAATITPVIRKEPWEPEARRELLATASRVRALHAEQGQRLAANRQRYEQTRAHSRELRERIEARRARRPTRRDRA
ncbi:MAG TPA: helix-turn-helix domain-containing protein [Baekduia sp.]|uniref:helix-turn-helix domain-containing protein n=1 Tax=Baekduia sp. TaxID=2600305 RepID=UPI002C52E610|nr:helix-turn-helix domain-containing protein [Baekduia sp.]HMJ36540.1 helix-turn-helix domain-containing protein [Baekduia sp.]